jgi:Sigma-70, region 4
LSKFVHSVARFSTLRQAMASLDGLPADQRAVLQLVLQQGRSYDQIAEILSIDRAAVRQRALSALDALGPQTSVAPEQRALITDYLLGQLPPRVAEDTRAHLAESAADRAWARVVASELAPLAREPLPEIPVETTVPGVPPEPVQAAAGRFARAFGREPRTAAQPADPTLTPAAVEAATGLGGDAGPAGLADDEPPAESGDARSPRSSRRGGAALLVLLGAAVVAVVVVLLVSGGGSKNKNQASTTSASTSAASTSTATSTTGTRVVGQINLTSPGGSGKTAGIAEVLKQGTTNGIAIVAQHVPPSTKHDAYAVWLYNSPSDAHILGFVNPGVGSNGRLSTAGALPSNAGRYKQLIVTLETHGNPKQPGKIVLQGQLTGI